MESYACQEARGVRIQPGTQDHDDKTVTTNTMIIIVTRCSPRLYLFLLLREVQVPPLLEGSEEVIDGHDAVLVLVKMLQRRLQRARAEGEAEDPGNIIIIIIVTVTDDQTVKRERSSMGTMPSWSSSKCSSAVCSALAPRQKRKTLETSSSSVSSES
jgi:hypothetical protein